MVPMISSSSMYAHVRVPCTCIYIILYIRPAPDRQFGVRMCGRGTHSNELGCQVLALTCPLTPSASLSPSRDLDITYVG